VWHCRKKPDSGVNSHVTVTQTSGPPSKIQSSLKKKRPPSKATKQNHVLPVSGLHFLGIFAYSNYTLMSLVIIPVNVFE
jgi:hypothetical protein